MKAEKEPEEFEFGCEDLTKDWLDEISDLEEQEEKPDDTRKKRSRQDRNLRHQNLTRIGIREICHEDSHGKTDTTKQRCTKDVRPVHIIRKRRDLKLHDQETEEEDTDGLAQDKASKNA